jgi:hypothetical protein
MVNTYGAQAKAVAQNSINTGNALQENIIDYVSQSVRNDSTYEIGLPVAIKTIDGNNVTFATVKE